MDHFIARVWSWDSRQENTDNLVADYSSHLPNTLSSIYPINESFLDEQLLVLTHEP